MSVVRVAFLWHMHQPCYRDPLSGTVVLPWVRLHALKDYLGMVRVLEETPSVHATFNLVPVLLDQLEAYVRGEARDSLQEVSLKPAEELDEGERVLALRGLFMAHENLRRRFPRLLGLLEARGPANDDATLRSVAPRFSAQDYRDLQVLAKLMWIDPDQLAADPGLRALAAKGEGFGEEDKRRLAEHERRLLAGVVPAYRAAMEDGRIELSTSPYYHPILPLLCDSESHHEAHPGAPLPRRYRHPEDAADQIRRAVARHEELFGRKPDGLWPPEGSISEETVREIARAGLRWTASDESVLERSANRPLHRDSRGTAYPLDLLYRPWARATDAGPLAILFRDRALSDLIGFSYTSADPERAAADLLDRFRRIGERWKAQGLAGDPVVGVMLDGENAWEYFKSGGRDFLRLVYRGLEQDPGLAGVTVSEAVRAAEPLELPRVFAGSWIHADFSVWIGHGDDRRAWDLLADARDRLEESRGAVPPERWAQAMEHFRSACGSDWFWWYGEEHSSENDFEFDRLFRRTVRAVYECLGLAPPEELSETLITTRHLDVRQSHPTGEVRPVLDGRITSPEEWMAAGVHRVGMLGTTMHRGPQSVRELRFGRGGERLFVLIETSGEASDLLATTDLALSFPGPTALRYRFRLAPAGVETVREEQSRLGWARSPSRVDAAVGSVVEAAIPLEELRRGPGGLLFRVLVLQDGLEIERHPETGPIEIALEEVSRD